MLLRDYQLKAVEDIRAFYRLGKKKVLLHLATGAGKTVIFSHILKSTATNGKKAIMVVRGKQLVHQAGERLYREQVPFGVYQANHWNKNRDADIQLCSIDTLYRRRIAPPADLVVIDEAHFAVSDSFIWLAQQYPNAFFLCVTATPFPKKSLMHVANEVVFPIGIKGLIDLKFLVPPRYFAPSKPDLDGLKIDSQTQDYNIRELAERVGTNVIVGDIVRHYKKISPDQPAICFAVNKDHSKKIVDQFLTAGIAAVHIEDSTKDAERTEVLRKHRDGEIKVICNVGILCTGVDMPWLRNVIMARPTKSLILMIQQAGRGTRPYDGKENFILTDHAGNIEEHGLITDDHEAILDAEIKKRGTLEKALKTCPKCFAIFEPPLDWDRICPECGHAFAAEPRKIEMTDGELTELDLTKIYQKISVMLFCDDHDRNKQITWWINEAGKKRYLPGWVFYRMKIKYGEAFTKQIWRQVKAAMPKELRTRKPDSPNPPSDRIPI